MRPKEIVRKIKILYTETWDYANQCWENKEQIVACIIDYKIVQLLIWVLSSKTKKKTNKEKHNKFKLKQW